MKPATNRPAAEGSACPTTEPLGSFDVSRICRFLRAHLAEVCGVVFLVTLVAYLLQVSWRKWPDPIVDSGPQWYAAWRISEGGMLFKEILWVYGPLSAYFNGLLFKVFGPNLTVLFSANLVVYSGILFLAYYTIRRAWGPLAAFASCGVFIAVFSFSQLTWVGNYNYIAPYSHESTHGMLLMLSTALVAARWSKGKSLPFALLLGLQGGLALVLKPEFILGGAVLGCAALLLRFTQHRPVQFREYLLLIVGIISPTVAFTAIFARVEPVPAAFAHASNAWWLVLVEPYTQVRSTFLNGLVGCFPSLAAWQKYLVGLDHPRANGLREIQSGVRGALVIAGFGVAGWLANRGRRLLGLLIFAFLCAGLLVLVPWQDGWAWAGRCLPLLLVGISMLIGLRLVASIRAGEIEPNLVMQLMLTLLALILLTRMVLFSRVYHYGFFQAALAAMVVTAALIREMPSWVGTGRNGRYLSVAGVLLILTLFCAGVTARSDWFRGGQTQSIGSGHNQFFALNREANPMGSLVDWTSKSLSTAPPQAKLLVVPEGLAINFLSKHVSPVVIRGGADPEKAMLDILSNQPPEFVVLLTRNEDDPRVYGAPGNPGFRLMRWIEQNYTTRASWGDPFSESGSKGARIMSRNEATSPGPRFSIGGGASSRALEYSGATEH